MQKENGINQDSFGGKKRYSSGALECSLNDFVTQFHSFFKSNKNVGGKKRANKILIGRKPKMLSLFMHPHIIRVMVVPMIQKIKKIPFLCVCLFLLKELIKLGSVTIKRDTQKKEGKITEKTK